ncbi:MAG: TlpA family protein disulfide reductase [Phycisphaerae bacterium]
MWILSLTLGLVCAGQPAVAPASEEELWREIAALRDVASTQPFAARLPAEVDRRRSLIARLRTYQNTFPGGAHRDEAVSLELLSLFELGTLEGGRLDALCARAGELGARPPSDGSAQEAAYWEIVCRRHRTALATTQPTPVRVLDSDAGLLREYAAYAERFPASRHVPRMAVALFDDALRRDDRVALRQIVEQVQAAFPDHAVTQQLRGALRRVDAQGQRFWLSVRLADGSPLDTREYAGHPVLIVVWAEFEPAATRCARAVDEFAASHADVRVVGVNLDDNTAAASVAAQRLGLGWKQFNDGLGWANEFAREWGVRAVPTVFVIDRNSRLVGAAGADDWRTLAERALAR